MIGVFDSGIGGLTVVKALMESLPGYNIVYFGDTARTPYGTKSLDTVIDYSIQNTEFLLNKGAKIIVIACNTASSAATQVLSEKFDVPIFEVVTPAVEAATSATKKGQIGVIGTRATINSGIYERLIKEKMDKALVYSAPCPLLVPLVEEGWLKKPETKMIVKKYIAPLKTRQIDTLILGCTHYPVLKEIISAKTGKRVEIIDSSIEVSKALADYLAENPKVEKSLIKAESEKGDVKFFVSDITPQFEKTASLILKQKIRLEHVKN